MPSSETINKDTCNGNFMRYDSLEFTLGQKVAHAHTFLHNHSTDKDVYHQGCQNRWTCSVQNAFQQERRNQYSC